VSAKGIFVELTKRLLKTREDAKRQISLLKNDDTLSDRDRTRGIASLYTKQQVAKDRMNATVGVWACTNAGCMSDLPQAAKVYDCAKECLHSVLSMLKSEFATCRTCGCTHHFGLNIADTETGYEILPKSLHNIPMTQCEAPLRCKSLRLLETVTDSVVFALSCGDTEYTAVEVCDRIQRTCFGDRSPICITLERICSIWMYPNPSSCFALPLHDADACNPASWLNKGPLLNPAKQKIDKLRLTRALFAAIACMHLQNFPKTAHVAHEMITLTIERLRLSLTEFRRLVNLTARVCPPTMQQTLSRLYEPITISS
jgi:hypothetical protein